MSTKIEYVDESWNPLQDTRKGKSGRGYHCTKCSPGCLHCWAETMNKRFGNGLPFDNTPVKFEILPDVLGRPLHWKKPRRIGVQFMGDLFHERMPWPLIERVFMAMLHPDARHHKFLLLTKRDINMREFVSRCFPGLAKCAPHILPGLTICTQGELRKLRVLLQTPGARHWVSLEPMLECMDLAPWLFACAECGERPEYGESGRWRFNGQSWEHHHGYPVGHLEVEAAPRISGVALGGESGFGSRALFPPLVRRVRDQCQAAGVRFFFKGWGDWFPRDQWEHSPELVLPDDDVVYQEARTHIFPDGTAAHRIGKKRAGRLLDGRTWDETLGG